MMGRNWILLALSYLAAVAIVDGDDVPRKMKQLYKQHKRHGALGDVNTIRYISAQKGSESSTGKLLFNLNSLQKQNETFIGAELHFYRRSVEEMSTIQIDTFEISSYYISFVERKRLSPAGKGWQQINITDSVRQCTNTIKTNNRLGIAFSDVKSDLVTVPVDMPQFLKHHELPFLLLYSHNTRSLEMDQITDHTKLSRKEMTHELNNMVNPKSGKLGRRKRRDVYDNRIEELSDVLLGGYNAEDTYNEITNKIEVEEFDPQVLTRQSTQANEELNKLKEEDADKLVLEDSIEEIQYIPWPKIRVKNKKAKHRNSKSSVQRTKSVESGALVPKACGRKPLRINLDDIGWGNQIIEPRRIDAYYCSGACQFPFSYGRQLTNHATLQSLLTAVHHKSKIPQPCCVPDKLQPVTVLYYDADKNVVLKAYADMSVESCVCR